MTVNKVHTLYKDLYNLYSKDIFFEQYSGTYIKELFMYISINAFNQVNLVSIIIPTAEIVNIFNNLFENNQPLYQQIMNVVAQYNGDNSQFKYLNLTDYLSEELSSGQDIYINKMKQLFNHEYISTIITNLNLNISYHDYPFVINCLNIITVKELIQLSYEYLQKNNLVQVSVNRLAIRKNRSFLLNKEKLYNIDLNSNLNSDIIIVDIFC